MNDHEKVSVKTDIVSELVKTKFGSHRMLAQKIAQLYEENKVAKPGSDSTVYRMMTEKTQLFKARDVRTLARGSKL